MTASLTPALALEFITALSADIRAGIVLGAGGEHLAGPAALAEAARALPDAPHLEGGTARGAVFAARDERHTIVVVTGPFALPRVTRLDLETALSALGGQTSPTGPPQRLDDPLVSAVLRAV
ncbi:hypothetical protein OM076_34620 [Solirubrobacter ginsenosidimutans]|uniref:Uncharacterized protein n=1 Tax=Solirubrobacter ginsenosidimutans TaxID=490573 RepID=A0A9X3N1U0_9ACTN|nr:hypothetical protein [Solirubrobacter ginsenosidimutans]MDA0165455.1 hypothetical protein [Solirubrobacter ginsenosidimutans]